MIGPDKTMPSPTPTPRMDERNPIPPTTRSRGNSSLMMPKASGNTAPPAPVMIRPASMIGKVVARALIRVPRVSTTRIAARTLSFPIMSPTRPRIGVQMAALSRYPVSSQATASADACSECSRDGRAGIMRDCMTLNASADRVRTAKVS